MNSRTQFSASGKLRVSAYVGACAAWAASGHEAVADPIHEYFDPSKNSVQVTDELVPSDWNLGVAGNFNFILDPPLQGGENPRSGFIWAAQLDINGFVPSELKFSTIGATTQLQSGVRTDYYYGAALRRYIEGEQIDGDAILGAGGATDYTAGYLFQFDDNTGSGMDTLTTMEPTLRALWASHSGRVRWGQFIPGGSSSSQLQEITPATTFLTGTTQPAPSTPATAVTHCSRRKPFLNRRPLGFSPSALPASSVIAAVAAQAKRQLSHSPPHRNSRAPRSPHELTTQLDLQHVRKFAPQNSAHRLGCRRLENR